MVGKLRLNPVTSQKLKKPGKLGRRASTTEAQLRDKFGMVADDARPLIAYLGLDKPTSFLGSGSGALVWEDPRDKDRIIKITRDPMDGEALAFLSSIQLSNPELLKASPRVFKVNTLKLSAIDEEVDSDDFMPTYQIWAATVERLTDLFGWEKKLKSKKSWADAVYVARNVLYQIFGEDSIAGVSASSMVQDAMEKINKFGRIDKRDLVFRDMIDGLPKIARSMIDDADRWVEEYVVDQEDLKLTESADLEWAAAILAAAGHSMLTIMKYGIYVPDIAGRNWGVRLGPTPREFDIMLFDFGLSAGGENRSLNLEVLET